MIYFVWDSNPYLMPYEGTAFTIKLTKYGGPTGIRTPNLMLAKHLRSRCAISPYYCLVAVGLARQFNR